jgi:3-dehydroquinate dehydratase
VKRTALQSNHERVLIDATVAEMVIAGAGVLGYEVATRYLARR